MSKAGRLDIICVDLVLTMTGDIDELHYWCDPYDPGKMNEPENASRRFFETLWYDNDAIFEVFTLGQELHP